MCPTRGNRAKFSWQSLNKCAFLWIKATAFVVVLDFRRKLLSSSSLQRMHWPCVGGIGDIYDADKITNVFTSHPPVCHLKLSSSSHFQYFGVMNVDLMSRLTYWFKGWWWVGELFRIWSDVGVSTDKSDKLKVSTRLTTPKTAFTGYLCSSSSFLQLWCA